MLNQLKLKTKIALLVLATLAGLIVLTTLSTIKGYRDLQDAKRETIQSVLEGV